MELTSETFEARIFRGNEVEDNFVEYVESTYGFRVIRASQHESHPRDKLKRHFPDMIIVELGKYVQVKDGRRSGEWRNVIAEVDSIKACQELYRMDHQVWAVWQYPDRSWHGNTIQNLLIVDVIPEDRSRAKGSGTPFYKIRKTSLKPLSLLINGDRQPKLF